MTARPAARSRRWLFLALGVAGCALRPGHLAPGSTRRVVTVQGVLRSYVLHVPSKTDRTRPRPLVIVLHGYAMSGAQMEGFTGFSRVAGGEGALVAYPDGEQDARGRRHWAAQAGALADLAFLSAIIEDVNRDQPVDRARVFVAGFSNGGALAYRAALALASRVAAIGVVAGRPGPAADSIAIPVIAIHGTDDPTIPYGPIPVALGRLGAAQGCDSAVVDTLAGDAVIRREYPGCRAASEVVLYSIVHGRHRWPGGGSGRGPLFATEVIWRFFRAHPKAQ